MTRLMGENMMRKDGEAHQAERKILFPAVSPRTVQEHWRAIFAARAKDILDRLTSRGACDLVTDYAMPVSAAALKAITGLVEMTEAEMDRVSQQLTRRVKNLAERYETPMPQMVSKVTNLEQTVNKYLEKMGFSWK